MFLVLLLLFVVAPIVELYVIVQVAGGIGIPETILLLIAMSVVGTWLARFAGLTVLRRLQATVRKGQVPSAEIVDGALVLFAGVLMIAPGFVSDALAILLLLPPSRAVVRGIVLRKIRQGGGFATIVGRAPSGSPGTGTGTGEVWDVEGWEDPPDRPRARSMTTSVPTRDGATVMLVRDGDHAERPLEVFMLRRHPSTAFGSVHVFPGGVVDPSDHDPALAARCPGRTDTEASALLGVPSGGLAAWIAAARECFEEAGVLLARTVDGKPLRLDDDPELDARFADHRSALHDGRRSLLEVLEQEDLVLALDDVHYVAHWITPEGEPKRYDTRFFLARAPEGQAYAHDDGELIDSLWVRPADALERSEAGTFAMIFPTISSLEDLGRHATADALLATQPGTPAAVNGGGW